MSVLQRSQLFWIFECISRAWVIKRTHKLHGNSGNIFDKGLNCLRRMQYTWIFSGWLQKKWQLGCHCWSVDIFYVYTKIIIPKLHSNISLSYLFSRDYVKILNLNNMTFFIFFFIGPPTPHFLDPTGPPPLPSRNGPLGTVKGSGL